MSYNEGFAAVYDSIIERQVDFAEYCRFALDKCKNVKNALDLGCGSGLFSEILEKNKINVTAVDLSSDMLSIASTRIKNAKLICADIADVVLNNEFDAAFCTLDTLNHITNKRKFAKCIKNAAKHIKSGGYFVFDVNTVYKHKCVLKDNTFIFEDENYYLVWQNAEHNNIVSIMLDLFVEGKSGYERYIEDFSERAYDDEYIKSLLLSNGFCNISCFDFESFGKPKKTSEKIIYIAQKG